MQHPRSVSAFSSFVPAEESPGRISTKTSALGECSKELRRDPLGQPRPNAVAHSTYLVNYVPRVIAKNDSHAIDDYRACASCCPSGIAVFHCTKTRCQSGS